MRGSIILALDNPIMDSQKELQQWIGMRGKERPVNSLLSLFHSHSHSPSHPLNTLLTNSLLSFFLSLTTNIKIKSMNGAGVTHFPLYSQEWSLWVSGLLFSLSIIYLQGNRKTNSVKQTSCPVVTL